MFWRQGREVTDPTGGLSGTTANQGQSGQADFAATLNKVFQDINKAMSGDTDHFGHHGDRYVTGDVNWDGYELQSLVGMVASPADPSQVDTVAGLWRTNGAAITQGAENLSQSLTTLLSYWQGSAANQATAAVTNTANWITTVGETAGKLADSVEDAGGALRSAQSTMPSVSTTALVTSGFNPAAAGAGAATAAGPAGAATGALMGGLTSMFDAGASDTAAKQQAVQTMQRYQQAATTIDTNTPQFAAPAAWTSSGIGSTTTSGTGALTGAGATSLASASGSALAGQNLSQTTAPSFADNPAGRWNALTGGGKIGGIGGGGGGSFAGALLGAGGVGEQAADRQKAASASGSSSGVVNETGGVAARGDASSIMEDVGTQGTAGTPGAPGMGAPGARMGGGQEGDYRRRIPFEEEPFTTGLKAVPPVIGLNPTD